LVSALIPACITPELAGISVRALQAPTVRRCCEYLRGDPGVIGAEAVTMALELKGRRSLGGPPSVLLQAALHARWVSTDATWGLERDEVKIA
jgi:hypothetical protein